MRGIKLIIMSAQYPLQRGPDAPRVLYLVLVSLALRIIFRCAIMVLAVVAAH